MLGVCFVVANCWCDGCLQPYAADRAAAAHRLLSQRTAGEECAATEEVIDQELGLSAMHSSAN
ncbi:hypothetical protein AO989_31995 [Pseudomonas aeruginosa]|nr:hypothetical protein AO905_33490 [Pseudomonas aeruginosa]OPD74086.1 hypothetical protein AO907_36405 [Pseudomonas aeruginosa]OPD87723.1 hypothetical protein AO954_34775 [Pseudomonas aeruginosa]OPD90648.1 hypothetical protein AO964_33715 [Pseudomonas aeruginosa]OPD98603.1 hypothetical protein AO989_31995 [Pseudomonas aeruginosa]